MFVVFVCGSLQTKHIHVFMRSWLYVIGEKKKRKIYYLERQTLANNFCVLLRHCQDWHSAPCFGQQLFLQVHLCLIELQKVTRTFLFACVGYNGNRAVQESTPVALH